MAHLASERGDDGTNRLIVSDIAEHVVDVPLTEGMPWTPRWRLTKE